MLDDGFEGARKFWGVLNVHYIWIDYIYLLMQNMSSINAESESVPAN